MTYNDIRYDTIWYYMILYDNLPRFIVFLLTNNHSSAPHYNHYMLWARGSAAARRASRPRFFVVTGVILWPIFTRKTWGILKFGIGLNADEVNPGKSYKSPPLNYAKISSFTKDPIQFLPTNYCKYRNCTNTFLYFNLIPFLQCGPPQL